MDKEEKKKEYMEDEDSEDYSSESEDSEEITPQKSLQNFIRPGKVIILVQGRRAGSKAVVLQNNDNPEKKKYNHSYAYVCGISKYPKSIRKKMSKKQIERRTRFKCFLKRVAYSHIMPTRYGLDIKDMPEVENISSIMKDPSRKKKASAEFHNVLNKKYLSGKNQWFFTKLRF